MAGLFDFLSTEDPNQAAYNAMMFGLLGGKGNLNQRLSQGGMNAMEMSQQARTAQARKKQQELQQQMQMMEMDKMRRGAAKEAKAQESLDWFKGQLESPYDAAVGTALGGGGGPTAANAQKMPPIDPIQSMLHKGMKAGLVDPMDYVKTLQKDKTPFKLGIEERLVRPDGAGGFKELISGSQKLTDDQREYNDAVKQGFKGSILDYQIALKTAGANRIVTNVNAYTPASEEAQKEFMKSTRVTYDALKTAPVVLQNIEQAKKLVPAASAFMGPGGEGLLVAAKFLNNRIGMDINVEGVKGAEELRTRLFTQIMENLKKMDAQPSQLQQKMMMEGLGNLGTDPQALPKVLDVMGQTVKTKVALHNKEVADATKRGVRFPYDPTVNLGDTSIFDQADAIIRKP